VALATNESEGFMMFGESEKRDSGVERGASYAKAEFFEIRGWDAVGCKFKAFAVG
jgi:hypothetical protein